MPESAHTSNTSGPNAVSSTVTANPPAAADARILVVEDNLQDFDVITKTLSDGNLRCDFTRVSTEVEFRESLRVRMPDIVLCDCQMEGFGGSDALKILKKENPDTPI